MENVLGFSGARNVDLDFRRPDGGHAGWTVIAGRNGAGKTSLLRCIAAMLTSPPESSTPHRLPLWRVAGSTPGKIGVEVTLDAEERQVLAESAGLPDCVDDPSLLFSCSYTFPGLQQVKGSHNQWALSAEWTSGMVSARHYDVSAARPVPSEIWPTKNSFTAGYGPFRRLSATLPSPLSVDSEAHPDPVGESMARLATLFRDDASLGEGVAWLVGLQMQSLEGRAGATRLLKTVLELLGDGLLPDDHEIVRVNSDGLWVRRAGREFRLRELSDGYKVVASLVLDIVRNLHLFYGSLKVRRSKQGVAFHTPGVVLIDEVDAHLHVSWQQRIGEWLKRHFPKIQFIVTTHSPYICQSADPGGLIWLPGPGEDAAPRVVDENTYRRIVYGTGDDAALSDLFGLDTPYSREAEKARRELVGLEEKVFAGTATKREVARYRELSERLNSSLEARVDEVSGRLSRLT